MEILTSFLQFKIRNEAAFSFHWRTKELKLSHVIFADDIFLFVMAMLAQSICC